MVDIELLESNVDVSNTPPADYSFRKVKSLNGNIYFYYICIQYYYI